MNGSLQVNKLTTPQPQNKEATLEITFESNILRTYQTTISTPIPASAPRAKFEKMSTHDVCSASFNLRHVLDQLQSPTLHCSQETVISDILLDQNILPGIGNIIKVEGLHEARIHPKRTLASLSEQELSYVIVCCKEYAMKWLNSGSAPPKYVYNHTICGSCAETSVTICRVGGTNRTTFWCVNCQVMDANSCSSKGKVIKEQSTNDSLPGEGMIRKICPTHGPSGIILRRCKKKGMNEQRIFYTCKTRGCNYFCWADSLFPNCKCGKRSVMRVSKTDKTGGQWFFYCAKSGSKANGCGYFQWAEKKYLHRYGHLLTPLL